MAKQGVQGMKVMNAYCDMSLIVLPLAIVTHLLKRLRRLVPEIVFSQEKKDWPAYKTRIMACAEDKNILSIHTHTHTHTHTHIYILNTCWPY